MVVIGVMDVTLVRTLPEVRVVKSISKRLRDTQIEVFTIYNHSSYNKVKLFVIAFFIETVLKSVQHT